MRAMNNRKQQQQQHFFLTRVQAIVSSWSANEDPNAFIDEKKILF